MFVKIANIRVKCKCMNVFKCSIICSHALASVGIQKPITAVDGEAAVHPKIQMDEDEREAFLERNKTLRVATNSSDGFPHNVPVGYQYHDGRIYFPSDERSKKIANIKHDEKVCCIVDEGTAGDDYEVLRGVMIQGRATIYDEGEHETMTHEELMGRIFEGDIKDQDRYDRVDRVVVEVIPENVVAWDFSKVN